MQPFTKQRCGFSGSMEASLTSDRAPPPMNCKLAGSVITREVHPLNAFDRILFNREFSSNMTDSKLQQPSKHSFRITSTLDGITSDLILDERNASFPRILTRDGVSNSTDVIEGSKKESGISVTQQGMDVR